MRKLTPENISKVIKAYRKEKKLSQRAFAKEVGLSYRMLQNIEKGSNTTIERLTEIMDYMGYEMFLFRK